MGKSIAKQLFLSAVLLGFTGLASTTLFAIDHDGFQQRPPKKSVNKPAENTSATKATNDDHHDHDGIQKPKKSTKKTKMIKDAQAEKPHEQGQDQKHEQHHDDYYDQHHDHDGLKVIPKAIPKKAK